MKNTIKHIVTIEDSLNEEYKHLVEINNKLVVFEFDKYDILKHIEHSNTYSFANMLTPIKFFEWFKNGRYFLFYTYFIEKMKNCNF